MSDSEPWVIRWAFTTGYSGQDRLKNADRVVIFCETLFSKLNPPEVELRHFSVRNEETDESLHEYLTRQKNLTRPVSESTARLDRLAHMTTPGGPVSMALCGTCDGSGKITIIQTGKTKPCTRCNGTGKE